jgi:hypothetical protein
MMSFESGPQSSARPSHKLLPALLSGCKLRGLAKIERIKKTSTTESVHFGRINTAFIDVRADFGAIDRPTE